MLIRANFFNLITLLAALCQGCNSDYEISLPNGYRLMRTDSSTIAIFEPNDRGFKGLVVGPTITQIGIHNNYVFGHVEKSPSSPIASYSVAGFFIINTQSMEVSVGLEKKQWEQRLKDLRINSPLRSI